jgi:hypothetical protein
MKPRDLPTPAKSNRDHFRSRDANQPSNCVDVMTRTAHLAGQAEVLERLEIDVGIAIIPATLISPDLAFLCRAKPKAPMRLLRCA